MCCCKPVRGYYGVPVDGYIPPTGPLGHWWPAEQDVPLGPLSLGVQTYGTPRATWPAGPFPWLLEWSDDQTRFAWRLPTSVTLIGRDARCTLHHREKSLQPIHAALICLPHVVRLVPLCCPPTLTDTRERYVDLRADAMFEVGDWVFHLRRVPQPYAGLADKFPRVSADPGASQASEFSSMSPSADDEVSENLQFPPLGTAKSG
ncbi:MAG: hypothetical protein KatS3mg114_0673 [Planctomycetaceae bacterium]|nr:MAG: hypothetical protein KatS3mg114_0673 [Planctomycetaceae bacterium]